MKIIQKNLPILLVSLFILIMLLSFTKIAFADTYITNSDIKKDWVFTASSSPYILNESIYIPEGYRLTIESGVIIKSGDYIEGDGPNTISSSGVLNIGKEKEGKVYLNDLGTIGSYSGYLSINNTELNDTGLELLNSTTTIKNSEIKNSNKAIVLEKSYLRIDNSSIVNNVEGIHSKYSPPIYMVNRDTKNKLGMGGIGNAEISNLITDSSQNNISIENSNIEGNIKYGIKNDTENYINAIDVWWGSVNGPSIENKIGTSTGDVIHGNVIFDPISKQRIINRKCCSSIIFFPGIQSSRLYKENVTKFGTSTNDLWEPNTNSDVKKLFLNEKGQSIDSEIKTGKIIDKAYGIIDIYDTFIKLLDEKVKNNEIKSWLAIPYDWRLSVMDIVDLSLIQKIESAASNSITGNVTIITHSNGGLLAKSLILKLKEIGKDNLIDKVIFIAMPESGTPQAILGMLHGYGQSIFNGNFLDENTGREFSKNMPSAYSLIPSGHYFKNNKDTIIEDDYSSNNKIIKDYQSLSDFLVDNSFSLNSSDDINTPLKLNKDLFNNANSLHSKLDNLNDYGNIKTISLYGWGNRTTKGIKYSRDAHCAIFSKCLLEFMPTFSMNGDGTVLINSYLNSHNKKIVIDLNKIKDDTKKKINHTNILTSDIVLKKIDSLLSSEDFVMNTANSISTTSENNYEKYFSNDVPNDENKYLNITVHSPVNIDVYDNLGNHTGKSTSTDLITIFDKYDTDIPDSFYSEYGRVKFLSLPYERINDYKIIISGQDTGVFSLKSEIIDDKDVIATSTFNNIPVTTDTKAELKISDDISNFTSSTSLSIDINGDNKIDLENVYSNSTSKTEMINNLIAFRNILQSLDLNKELRYKKLITRLEKMEYKLKINNKTKKNINIKNKKIKYTKEYINSELLKLEKIMNDLERRNID